MANTIEGIEADFALLPDWEDRFEYLIDLGRALDPLQPEERSESNRVLGCMSQVWLVAAVEAGPAHDPAPRLCLRGESDALIVQGLVAVVLATLSDRTPADILATDVEALFRRLGLDTHLTPNRRNGFASMVGRVKALAAALVEAGSA
jgi:cysteine desulfuration protein SufE